MDEVRLRPWYNVNMQREPFETGEIYHIYNRGVEKRKIFMDTTDHVRFIHDIYEFNDQNPTVHFERDVIRRSKGPMDEVGLRPYDCG